MTITFQGATSGVNVDADVYLLKRQFRSTKWM